MTTFPRRPSTLQQRLPASLQIARALAADKTMAPEQRTSASGCAVQTMGDPDGGTEAKPSRVEFACAALNALRGGTEPGVVVDTLMELATLVRSSADARQSLERFVGAQSAAAPDT